MALCWAVAPCSLLEVYRRFRVDYCLYRPDNVGITTSETSVNLYQTTMRNAPEKSYLRNPEIPRNERNHILSLINSLHSFKPYFFKIGFNIINRFTFRSLKWSLSSGFPTKFPMHFLSPLPCYVAVHIFFFNFIALKIPGKKCKLQSSSPCIFLPPHVMYPCHAHVTLFSQPQVQTPAPCSYKHPQPLLFSRETNFHSHTKEEVKFM
jgi:hypothetical protein